MYVYSTVLVKCALPIPNNKQETIEHRTREQRKNRKSLIFLCIRNLIVVIYVVWSTTNSMAQHYFICTFNVVSALRTHGTTHDIHCVM